MVVVIFRVLKLPALLGYLLVGILIGPQSTGLIPDNEDTRYLAEFGIVFLMFSVGLVLGGVFAMSSTAILAKMLAERLELNTPHGRRIIGILLFQDLAVVPLLILYPALGHGGDALARELLMALVKAGVVSFLLLTIGQRAMRGWFTLVARRKSSELFVLKVLFITLGLAWLTGLAGLSLALGAFLAGMLISETQYRYQVEEDIRPFRDVLLGLFSVTIGMRLDLDPQRVREAPAAGESVVFGDAARREVLIAAGLASRRANARRQRYRPVETGPRGGSGRGNPRR